MCFGLNPNPKKCIMYIENNIYSLSNLLPHPIHIAHPPITTSPPISHPSSRVCQFLEFLQNIMADVFYSVTETQYQPQKISK